MGATRRIRMNDKNGNNASGLSLLLSPMHTTRIYGPYIRVVCIGLYCNNLLSLLLLLFYL